MPTTTCRPSIEGDATDLVALTSMGAVAELATAVHRGAMTEDILRLAAVKIAQTTGHTMALVLQPDAAAAAFRVVASSGVSAEYVDDLARHPVHTSPGDRGEAPSSRVFRSGRPMVASSPHEAMPPEWERRAELEGIQSMLSVPLMTADEVGYVVNVYCGVAECFGERSVVAAENLTNLIGILLDLHRRDAEHRRHDQTQRTMIDALETKCRANRLVTARMDALHQLVAGGAPPEQVVAKISALSGASLEVADEYGRVLACAGTAQMQPMEQITRDLTVGGELVGTVHITYRSGPTSRVEAAGILHSAPALISLVLQRHWASMDAEARLRGSLVEEILAAPSVSERALVGHARARWGIDLAAPAWLVIARVSDSEGIHRPSRGLRTAAENLVRRTGGALLMAEHDQHLVALCEDSSSDRARQFAETLRRELTAYAGASLITVAVGGRNDSVAGHRAAYRQALSLLDLAAADNPGRTVAAEDFGIARLLLGVKDPGELLAFAEQTLGPLSAYDRRRGAGLLETLDRYLGTGCNVQETARLLHLHHNSVSYRLKRITEILGHVNIGEPQTLLRLELAMSVLRLSGITDVARAPGEPPPGPDDDGLGCPRLTSVDSHGDHVETHARRRTS